MLCLSFFIVVLFDVYLADHIYLNIKRTCERSDSTHSRDHNITNVYDVLK